MFKKSSVGFLWTWDSCKFIYTVLHKRVHKALCGSLWNVFFFFNFLVLMDVRVRVIEHIQIERSVSCVNGGVESHMILWVSESCLSCGFLGPQLFRQNGNFIPVLFVGRSYSGHLIFS